MSTKSYGLTGGLLFLFLFLCAQTVEKAVDKGNEYYKRAQYDLAERQYRLALQQDTRNATAQYNLANALHRQKKYDEANAVLAKLQQQNPAAAVKSATFYNQGVAYSRQKSLEESIGAYKAALRINPEDQQARENLQKALLELKKQQQQQSSQQQQPSRMSQSKAEQELKRLQEKEKQLQERLQNQGQKGSSMPKDW